MTRHTSILKRRIGIVPLLFLSLTGTSTPTIADDAEWTTFYEVYRLVRTNYVTETDAGNLFKAAIAAIARTTITGPENRAIVETTSNMESTVAVVPALRFLSEEEKIQHRLLLGAVQQRKLAQPSLLTTDLEDAAIRGMLSSLGPASAYSSPHDLAELQQNSASIGVAFGRKETDSEVRVISVGTNSPASAAGIEPGMRLHAIDSISIASATPLQAIITMLRGRPGTTVKLTIEQEVGHLRDYDVIRRWNTMEELTAKLIHDNVAYVKVNYFLRTTGETLRDKLKQLRGQDNHQFCGIVLDLRDNAGGQINGVVATADRFLDVHGTIVFTSGRTNDSNLHFSASQGIKESAPLVVLVNQNTSSGAEAVAAALQDYRRATVIGSATFGTATVQTMLPLANHGSLKLTTATMKRPSGKVIDKRGVLPDVCVDALGERKIDETQLGNDGDLRPFCISAKGSAPTESTDAVLDAALKNIANQGCSGKDSNRSNSTDSHH